jgi:DNA-binding winged helix-turn-helix (wHTH) protein/tetratricopeptide (TPR) repeat protein
MTFRAAFLTALPAPVRRERDCPAPDRLPGRRRLRARIRGLLAGLLGLLLLVGPNPVGPDERYPHDMQFRFAEFEVDDEAFGLLRDGEPVAIAPLPLKLLLHLLHRYPAAPSKDELMEALWPGTIVSEASLSQAVRAVRVALGEGARGEVLQTVRGRGFKIGVPVHCDSIAPEAAARPAPENPLVGRAPEMDRARLLLEQATGGRPQVLLLSGEPGIGKTRLAEEITAEAQAAGGLVLFGRASEGTQQPAYWMWVQILRAFATGVDTRTLDEMRGPHEAALATIVPELGTQPGAVQPAAEASGVDPEIARFGFFDAVASFLSRGARDRLVVLALDDLHWADDASLLLLEFLARELRPARLLIVGTTRDAEIAGRAALQRALAAVARTHLGFENLAIGGLDREAIARLVEAQAGQPPSDAVLDSVWERSEGNPLFAREVARWLAAGDAGRASDMPVGIQQVLRRRLAELPEDTRAALSVAAVVGREFGVRLLSLARGETPAATLGALEPAERAGIVESVGGDAGTLRFGHGLTQETLINDLSSLERARLHLQIADALASLHAAHPERILSELAAHYAAALPVGDPQPAFDYAFRAAETDLRLLAFEQASRDAALALRIADESGVVAAPARNRVLRLLADARFLAGLREEAARTWWELVDSARRSGDGEALADAAMALAMANVFTAHSHQETISLLREALDELGHVDSPRRARLLSWLARQLTWTDESDRQHELTREAVEMARRLDDTETLLDVLGAHGSVLELGGSDSDRRTTYEELLRVARSHGSRAFEADALTLRLQHRIELADTEGIDRDLAVLERLGEDVRHPFYQAFAARAKAMRALWRGDPDAEQRVDEATAAGQQVDREHAAVVLAAQLTALRRLQGRMGELEAGARNAADQYPMMASFRCGLASIQLEAGNEAAARASFERLAEGGFADVQPDRPNYALNLALLAEVCAALGDVDNAVLLRAKLAPLAGRYLTAPNAVAAGCASRHLASLSALLGEAEESERLFEEALEIEGRMGALPWRVATLLDRARARQARDAAAARRDVENAIELARASGLPGPLSAAESLLASFGPVRGRNNKSKSRKST